VLSGKFSLTVRYWFCFMWYLCRFNSYF